MVTVRPIRTVEDYEVALGRLHEIFQAEDDTDEGDERDILANLIEAYEGIHYHVPSPDPISAIKFRLDQAGLSTRDLVPYIGSRSKVSEVLAGKRGITMAMARALHKHLGIPAESLLGDAANVLDDGLELEWTRFPLKVMVNRRWIEGTVDLDLDAEEIIRDLIDRAGVHRTSVATLFRRGDSPRVNAKTDHYALAAWCWQVMALANASPPPYEYTPGSVTPVFLRDIGKLSRWSDGPRQAQAKLAEYGIVLQILEHLPKTYLDGATMWFDGTRPVIGMTLRYDRIDNFWFTLLHELAHLGRHLDGNTSAWFVDDLTLRGSHSPTPNTNGVEFEADEWAENALTPPDKWEATQFEEDLSPMEVIELAQMFEVHPAVVAGRVRFERRNYRLLSQFVGSGEVRRQFHSHQ